VFVDGCFWHGCPIHRRPLTTNVAYWTTKISNNQRRDAKVDGLLTAAGWLPMRVWEHEPADEAALRIATIVRGRRSSHPAELE
jgi:DNA mismatch endonuclease (patch repair protein)